MRPRASSTGRFERGTSQLARADAPWWPRGGPAEPAPSLHEQRRLAEVPQEAPAPLRPAPERSTAAPGRRAPATTESAPRRFLARSPRRDSAPAEAPL